MHHATICQCAACPDNNMDTVCLNHSAVLDFCIPQDGDNATADVESLALLVGLLHPVLVGDFAVLANASVLVNNGVADLCVVTNPDWQTALVEQILPLLVRLVVVSSHEHGILQEGEVLLAKSTISKK